MMQNKIVSLLSVTLTLQFFLPIHEVTADRAEARGGRGGGHRGGFRGRGGRGRGMRMYGGGGGYRNNYGNQALWGNWGGARGGSWGGWARPQHRFRGYGWGGWSSPYYGAGGGYGYGGYGSYPVDVGGGMYPTSSYSYTPATVSSFTWTSGSVSAVPLKSIEPEAPKDLIKYKSKFKLGPDADIIDNGKVAFHLTDDAFLLVSDSKLVAVEQDTGAPAMQLYPDEVLVWHVAQELDQQSLGLQAAQKRKSALLNSPLVKESKDKADALNKELKNIDTTIQLLSDAKKALGKIPQEAPTPVTPPEEGAMEIFASTWMLKDGSMLVIRDADGNYVYMDGRGTYKDSQKTPLKKAYPGKFEKIVFSYLKKLVAESNNTTKNLKDDIDDTQWALEKLKAELEEEYNSTSGKDSPDQDIVESKHRIGQAILRSEHRFAAITNQIKTMPGEVEAAKNLIKTLQK